MGKVEQKCKFLLRIKVRFPNNKEELSYVLLKIDIIGQISRETL